MFRSLIPRAAAHLTGRVWLGVAGTLRSQANATLGKNFQTFIANVCPTQRRSLSNLPSLRGWRARTGIQHNHTNPAAAIATQNFYAITSPQRRWSSSSAGGGGSGPGQDGANQKKGKDGTSTAELRDRRILYMFPAFLFGGAFIFAATWDRYCSSVHRRKFDDAGARIAPAERLDPNEKRRHLIRVAFTCDCGPDMPVQFVPLQNEMEVLVGEPSLAFFSVYNTTPNTIYGVSTYQMLPDIASEYINKLQCFCFEEQRIKPHEIVELPVFFYIDPDFAEAMETAPLERVVVSYTFFRVNDPTIS